MARACVICGGRPDSREHVWPGWLTKTLRGEGKFSFERGTQAGVLGGWSAPKLNHTTNRLCRSCNSRLGAELEDLAEPVLTPMIQGQETELGIDDQQLVAAWVIKTAAMLSLTFPPPQQFAPQILYEWLRNPYLLPPRVSVFLAAYYGRFSVFSRDVQRKTVDPLPGKLYSATVSIQHFVFKAAVAGDGDKWTVQSVAEREAEAAVRIWPIASEVVIWPPKFVLDDAALEHFAGSASA